MKAIIAAEIFPPDIGGPATYSKILAQALNDKKIDVKVICYSKKIENDSYSFPVMRVIRQTNKLINYWNYFWSLLKLAKDCDVIYAQGPVGSGLPAVVAGFLLSKRVVVKVVGDYAWEQARNSGQTDIGIDEFQKQHLTGKIATLKKIETFVCKKASKVITPSQYLKNIVKGWGIEENKIEVVYNAVQFKPIDPVLKDHQENWLITIARLVPWKGIDTIIKLMPSLIKEIPNLKFKIIGDGPQKTYLVQLVKDLNLDNQIELLGNMDHDQVMGYLHSADLFILNSGYEGLSHVIVEALSFNTPVIVSNIGGNPEIVIPGQTGELFEYNNEKEIKEKIIKFFKTGIKNIDLTKSEKRIEFFDRFSFQRMVEDTIGVLELINRNGFPLSRE